MQGSADPHVIIRAATRWDATRCAEIFLSGRRHAFPWHPEDRFGLTDYDDCVLDCDVLVAEARREVVGFVAVDRGAGFIHALFIDPAWRNRGIGTHLLDTALERLGGLAELACAARNAAARAFYESNGWVPANPGGGPHVLYRKSAGR